MDSLDRSGILKSRTFVRKKTTSPTICPVRSNPQLLFGCRFLNPACCLWSERSIRCNCGVNLTCTPRIYHRYDRNIQWLRRSNQLHSLSCMISFRSPRLWRRVAETRRDISVDAGDMQSTREQETLCRPSLVDPLDLRMTLFNCAAIDRDGNNSSVPVLNNCVSFEAEQTTIFSMTLNRSRHQTSQMKKWNRRRGVLIN